jgi:hypothetical protein
MILNKKIYLEITKKKFKLTSYMLLKIKNTIIYKFKTLIMWLRKIHYRKKKFNNYKAIN